MSRIVHPLPPVFCADSEVLILGSFPSVKSREAAFYYQHPQNRFWAVLSAVTHAVSIPSTVDAETQLLLENHLAIWDCIGSCEITGSRDSSIRDVIPNDIVKVLNQTRIRKIFCNGSEAYRCYETYLFPQTRMTAARLPSTSPANAAWSLPRLITAWSVILL